MLNSISFTSIYKPLKKNVLQSKLLKDCNFSNLVYTTKKDTFTKTVIKSDAEKYINSLREKIRPDNIIGEGTEAKVYALSDDYVIRVLKYQKQSSNQKFTSIPELFEGQNFGQAVMVSNDGAISINKLVTGKQMYPVERISSDTYLNSLRNYSELSDTCLERYVKDFSYLNKKGYKMDPNPENFLYDAKKDRIGFVDIAKLEDKIINYDEPFSHTAVMFPLVNGRQVFRQYMQMYPSERKEMFDLINKIEERILPYCEKYDIPKAKWDSK